MSASSHKYTISVKARHVNGANVVRYNGKCYYRMYQQGSLNTVPTSAVKPFYPNRPCFDAFALSSMTLSCYNCAKDEFELYPNTVMTIPDKDDTLQFKFIPDQDLDYSLIKFMYGAQFFTKTLQLSGDYVLFDVNGPHEHVFHKDSHPHAFSFEQNSNYYCLNYVAKGSYVFIMSIDSANLGTTTPVTTISGGGIIGVTPTPTPTTYSSVDPSGPDGVNYYAAAWWPTSGSADLVGWYDTAFESSLKLHSDNTVESIESRLVQGPALNSPPLDSPGKNLYNLRSPAWSRTGGIGNGPSMTFRDNNEFGGNYLSDARDEDGNISLHSIKAAFIVATYKDNRFDKNYVGLLTGQKNATDKYSGNLFIGAWKRDIWAASAKRANPMMLRKSLYSNDRGDYYVNGCVINEANDGVIGARVKNAGDGILYSGVNTTGAEVNVPGICLGAEYELAGGIQRGWSGNVAEVILFKSEPTQQEREDVEGYLVWKWGLADQLCDTHKWKDGPPIAPPPTPTPKPPEPTPTSPPAPPLPRGVPVGVNLVTMTQLLDVVSQRSHPATLWLGGYYESEWNLLKARLGLLSSDTLYNAISSSIDSVNQAMNVSTPDISNVWRSHVYNQQDINCGTTNRVIRLGRSDTAPDNRDNKVMYCLDHIAAGDSVNLGKSLLEITEPMQLDNNPDPVGSPTVWNLFVNTILGVDAGILNETVPYTGGEFDDHMKTLETNITIPLLIETPSYNFNTMTEFQTPLTTLYHVGAPDGGSMLNSQPLSSLKLSDATTRVDIVMEMRYDDLNLWHNRLIFEDSTTIDISVRLPGASPELDNYTNKTGDLPWNIGIEILDAPSKKGSYNDINTYLPSEPGIFIPDHFKTVESTIDGRTYKVTPYAGDWKANSSDEIISNSNSDKLPRMFVRIDRM